MRHPAALVFLCCCLSPRAVSQVRQSETTAQDGSPHAIVEKALNRLRSADDQKARFTCFKLEHNEVFDGTGRDVINTRKLFEETWINDLPYSRLVETEGKPLTGALLAEEQARFDRAVAERRSLALADRAALTGGHLVTSSVDLSLVLTPAYQLTTVRENNCLGQPCHEYQALRVLDVYKGEPVAPYTFRLWVTDRDPLLTRLEYDVTADMDELRQGSSAILEYQLVDGVPVLRHSRFLGFLLHDRHRIRVDTDNEYSHYRQFSTSVTVRPATNATEPGAVPQP